MKDYWLVKNEIDKTIEICFPNNKMNLINSLIATITKEQIIELRDSLLKTDINTEPYKIVYEYGSLEINSENIIVHFSMFNNDSKCFLYTKDLRNALVDYIEEYEKMMNEDVGLSK